MSDEKMGIKLRVFVNDGLVQINIAYESEFYILQTHVYGGDTISLAEMTECSECSIINRSAFIKFGVAKCRSVMRDESLRRGYEVQEWTD